MKSEVRSATKAWWCHGGGAAVLALLVVVSVFRAPRDGIFWAAVVFFLAHTGMAAWRYHAERRARITATVVHHHQSRPTPDPRLASVVFAPPPISSIIRLDFPPK